MLPSNTLNRGLSLAPSSPGMSVGLVPALVSWDTNVTFCGGLGGGLGAWLSKRQRVEGLLGTCWGSWASPTCLGERSVRSGTSSDPGGVSVCEGVAVALADPPANSGSGLGAFPAHRSTGRLPGGDFGTFSLEARVAHKGKGGAVTP